MPPPRTFWVYILANVTRSVLYTGVTNSLPHRLTQHRSASNGRAFSRRYRSLRLVYAEPYPTALAAIAREKQIKGGSRADKVRLIESVNPRWCDLAETL